MSPLLINLVVGFNSKTLKSVTGKLVKTQLQ